MRRTNGWVRVLVLIMAASVWDAPTALAAVTVDDVELLSRTRVGRTTFNYTYRLTATNTTPVQVDDAVAYLSLVEPAEDPDPSAPVVASGVLRPTLTYGQQVGTVLLDDAVTLGSIAPGATITSTDTFVIQQDRRFPLDTDSLLWEVGFTANVKLTGIVTDTVIPNANLTIEIDRTESGRPIVESGRPIVEFYQAIADPEGRYEVNVDFVSDKDFVDITALGVDDLDFVALRSIVGSAGSLLDDATDGPLQVSGEDVNPLNVTHVSTALAELALRINDDVEFTNDEDLTAAQALVNTDELIINAAVIKTVIDNANIDLPPGIADTQALLDDPDAFADYLADLEQNFPDELQTAIEETIDDLATGYTVEEVPGLLYLSLARDDPTVSLATAYEFDQNGSVTYVEGAGETTDATWTLNAAGEIVVTANDPPQTELFVTREVPPGSGNFVQVRSLNSTIEQRIVRVATGVRTDQVIRGGTDLTTFPDHVGVLPDEINVFEPDPEIGLVAFDEDGILPVDGELLDEDDVMVYYFHADNNSLGLSNPSLGADVLTFNANGTGSTTRRQFSFAWSVDTFGRLIVTFANGDRNEYARYAATNDDVVSLGVVVGRYGATGVSAADTIAVTTGAGVQFDAPTLTNRKFVGPQMFSGFSSLARFDYNFLPGGVGCRDSGSLADFDWAASPAGYAEITRQLFGSFVSFRTWQTSNIVTGKVGPRHWLIETVEFGDITGPGFPSDPTSTPGRISFYENARDLTGNTAPTAEADDVATTVDTPIFIPVLANDTDAEGDAIIITGSTSATLGGQVDSELDEFGQVSGFTYTPPPGVSGVTDSFTYSIADGSCAASPMAGAVRITIN